MNPFLHPEQRRRLLTAKTRELIAAVGGIEAAAEICARGKSTVARWQDFETGDSAPVECVMRMEMAAGVAIVSQALAESLSSCAPARTHTHAPARAREGCAEALAEMTMQAGTVGSQLVKALADGKVTATEAQMSSRFIGQLRRTIDEMETNLHGAVSPAGLKVVEG